MNLNERIVEFVLQKKLPEATLNGQSIVLTLVASVKENSDLVGYTVVVISLPNIEDEPTPGKLQINNKITLLLNRFLLLQLLQLSQNLITVAVIELSMINLILQ